MKREFDAFTYFTFLRNTALKVFSEMRIQQKFNNKGKSASIMSSEE